MKYDGEVIAEYDMSSGERTIDMKTPEQWVRGNMVFLITLASKDETKVEIEKIKESEKIFAKNTEVRVIDEKDSKDFINKNPPTGIKPRRFFFARACVREK